jgi:vancomycin resistance protein YoaR
MTAFDEVFAPGDQPLVAPRRRIWPRVVAAFFVGFVVCLGVAAGALVAWDAGYQGRVLAGVQAAGVDLSGLDRAAATDTLQAALDGYGEGRLVLNTTSGRLIIPYASFSRRADVDTMVAEALATGRRGSPFERAVGEVRQALAPVSIEPRIVLDASALSRTIDELVAPLARAPVDSGIRMDHGNIITSAALPGRAFDGAAAAASAIELVARIDAPAEVTVDVPARDVPATLGDDVALAAKAAAQRMIGNVVVSYGKHDWTLKAKTVRGWIRFEPGADGRQHPTVNVAAIQKSLKNIDKAVRRDPVSASYLKSRSGRIVGVIAGSNGRRLDPGATAAAIAAALTARGQGAPVAPVEAAVAKVAPKLTTAEALKHGPQMVQLGVWKTYFPISDRNFWGANIWRPAEIIDGTVLMPGQRFEWWSAIGPVSSARGFGPGGFIAGDHTEPTGALGGGMCSSSTTLFNAALRAGLQMGSRINHRYYIDRYPLGLDATVSKSRGGSQTMSFTNDMANPIVIRSFRYRTGGRGWVRYEIWGIPDGRSVSLSRPAVSNVRRATTRTVLVSSLPHGAREQVEYPANGMDVAVTRVVRKGGRVIHRETYHTRYALWNGIIHVGR